MKAKEFIPASKPRNFVVKNQKTAGAGAHKDKKRAEKQGDVKHKQKQFEQGVAEGSAHGYNVVKWYEKWNDQKKLVKWLRKEAGLPNDDDIYFDDADLVYGDKTIVRDALVDPNLKFIDLLNAVAQATGGRSKQKVQGIYREQGVAEGWDDEDEVDKITLVKSLQWPELVNKVNSAMKAMGWKGQRKDDGSFMFSTRGQLDDEWYIVVIDNRGNNMFTYALGTVEEGDPHIGDQESLPMTEASVSELMNAIREGFGLGESSVSEVSKDTLDRYVSKSSDAHGDADFKARMSKNDPDKRSYHIDQKKTAEKRRQGISRALDRMSREESVGEAKRPDRAMPTTDLRVGDRVVADTSKENYPGGHKQRVGIVTRVGQKGVHIRTDDNDEPEWHPYKIVKKQDMAEARQSAQVKLAKAWDQQQAKSAASRERAKELLNPAKKEQEKKNG